MQSFRSQALDSRIDKLFAGGDRFVELGCGAGQDLDALAGRYQDVVGIDASTARLEKSQSVPDRWKFVQANLDEAFPLDDASVDALYANQVIEHILDPLRFARESLRVLKPGGISVVTTPNVRYLKHIWRIVVQGLGPATANSNTIDGAWDDGHLHYFTHRDLRRAYGEAGFSKIESRGHIDLRTQTLSRKALDTLSGFSPVREFLSGNILLVARK